MIANNEKIGSRFFSPKPSLGVHTVRDLSFRLRTPLAGELFYKKN